MRLRIAKWILWFFTGAMSQKRGRFERAHKGTIFLDEIGELPPQVQVRMLRVLQNKEIERVGGTRTIPIDVRVIAATHCNLEEMVGSGQFREDLWFRLNVFPVRIPPLRDRTEDMAALVHHFIDRKSRQLRLPAPPPLAPGATECLTAYGWPGNIRELENVIERALILNCGEPLTFDPVLNQQPATCAAAPAQDEVLELDQVVAKHIRRVLSMTENKIHGPDGASELLGINASTLRNRMNKLGIAYKRRGK